MLDDIAFANITNPHFAVADIARILGDGTTALAEFEAAQTSAAASPGTPCDECGCSPCRCDETFAVCDNPEVEHPGKPCNHYTGPAETVELPEGIAPLPAPTTTPKITAPLVDEDGFEYDMSIDDTATERFDADGLEDTAPADQPIDWAEAMADEVTEITPADVPDTTIAPTPTGRNLDDFLIYDDNSNTLF